MPNPTSIKASALFDRFQASKPEVVFDAVLTKVVQGAYNVATGSYALTPTPYNCRVFVDATTPADKIFPSYVLGENELLVMIADLDTIEPVEGEKITFKSQTFEVIVNQNVLLGDFLHYAVVRKVAA